MTPAQAEELSSAIHHRTGLQPFGQVAIIPVPVALWRISSVRLDRQRL
jgi:hypothetical protein